MNTITCIAVSCSILAVLIVAGIVSKARAATEQPDYAIVLTDGDFEVREYPAMQLVTAPMGAAPAEANEKDERKKGNSSFMNLFRYIQGANEADRKIPMTAPVLIEGSNSDSGTMSFVLPSEVAQTGAPRPTNKALLVQNVAKGPYAALRFKGYRSREAEQRAEAELRVWLEKNNLQAEGDPLFAYYNAPWTPEFMRRNEVLLRLKEKSARTQE